MESGTLFYFILFQNNFKFISLTFLTEILNTEKVPLFDPAKDYHFEYSRLLQQNELMLKQYD